MNIYLLIIIILLFLVCMNKEGYINYLDLSYEESEKNCPLMHAKNYQTVSNLINEKSLVYKRFWKPFTIAVLNTHPKKASAKLLWKVILKTLFYGNNPLQPFIVKKSLDESLIKPGIEKIVEHGGKIKIITD